MTSSTLGAAHFIYDIFNSSKIDKTKPILFVTSDEKDALSLAKNLDFFNIPNNLLLEFDIEPYLGIYPALEILYKRSKVFHEASIAHENMVFVSSLKALIQKQSQECACRANDDF